MSSAVYISVLLFVVYVSAQAQVKDTVIRIPATLNVNSVEFAQDGSYFLALDRDTLRVWDVPSGKQLGTSIALSSIRGYATFLPGDSTILTVAYTSDSTFNIWNWRTGALVRSVKLYRSIDEAVVSKDGRYIAIRVHFPERQYELWNIASGTYEYVFLNDGYKGLLLDPTATYGVIESGTWIFRVNVKAHTVDSLHVWQGDLFRKYLSRDGTRIGYSRAFSRPLVFDSQTLDSLFGLDIDMTEKTWVMMDISPDNRWVLTTTTRRTGLPTLDLWDGSTGQHVVELAQDSRVDAGTLRISPDNKYVVIYNISVGMLLWPLNLSTVSVPAVTGSSQREPAVYPNPSRLDATVEWHQPNSEAMRLRVVTPQGKSVYTTEWSYRGPGLCRERIPVGQLASGVYFCEIESAGERLIRPFIVEH